MEGNIPVDIRLVFDPDGVMAIVLAQADGINASARIPQEMATQMASILAAYAAGHLTPQGPSGNMVTPAASDDA